MRGSSAVLTDSNTRLWELAFPRDRVLVTRTRAPYVALDGLIAFSKKDPDGLAIGVLGVSTIKSKDEA